MPYIDPYRGGWANLSQAGANISGMIERANIRRRERRDERIGAVAERAKRTGDISEWLNAMEEFGPKDVNRYAQLHGLTRTIKPGGQAIAEQAPMTLKPTMLEKIDTGGMDLAQPVTVMDLPGFKDKLEHELKPPESGNLVEPPTLEPTMAVSQPKKPPQFEKETPEPYEVPLPTTAEGMGIRATYEKQKTGVTPDWARQKMLAPDVERMIQSTLVSTKGIEGKELELAASLKESFAPFTEGEINVENLIAGPEKMPASEAIKKGADMLQDPLATPETTEAYISALEKEAVSGTKLARSGAKITELSGMAAMQNFTSGIEDPGQLNRVYAAAKSRIEKLTGKELPPVEVFQTLKKEATFSETFALLRTVDLSPEELTAFSKTGKISSKIAESIQDERAKAMEPTTSLGQLAALFAGGPDWEEAFKYWRENEGRVPPVAIAKVSTADTAQITQAQVNFAKSVSTVYTAEELGEKGYDSIGGIVKAVADNTFDMRDYVEHEEKQTRFNDLVSRVTSKGFSKASISGFIKQATKRGDVFTPEQAAQLKKIRSNPKKVIALLQTWSRVGGGAKVGTPEDIIRGLENKK